MQKHYINLLLLFFLVSCPQVDTQNTTLKTPNLDQPITGPINVTGRWSVIIDKTTGTAPIMSDASMNLQQFSQTQFFSGIFIYPVVSNQAIAITGNASTGQMNIRKTVSDFWSISINDIDMTGQFTSKNAYSGTYEAKLDGRVYSSGKISMTRATVPFADLKVYIKGATDRVRLTIKNDQKIVFEEMVTNNEVIYNLPKTTLNIIASELEGHTESAVQDVDLSSGLGMLNLDYTPWPFSVYVGSSPDTTVSNGEEAKIRVDFGAISGTPITIDVTLEGLPSGVRQLMPIQATIQNGPVPQFVEVPIASDSNTALADTPVRAVARYGKLRREWTFELRARPHHATNELGYSNWVVGPDNAVYLNSSGQNGVFRITAKGTRVQILNRYQGGDIHFAPDDSLWGNNFTDGYTRFDFKTNSTENLPYVVPGGGPWDGQPDGKKRIWYSSYPGLWCADLINKTRVEIPELKDWLVNDFKMVGDKIFTVRSGIAVVDINTFKVMQYPISLTESITGFEVIERTLVLSAGGKLYTLDLDSSDFKNITPTGWGIQQVLGHDIVGNIWVATTQGPNIPYKWVQLNPKTGNVLRSIPPLVTVSNGARAVVAPNGGLWASDQGGLYFVP
jgi:hypothetical protein